MGAEFMGEARWDGATVRPCDRRTVVPSYRRTVSLSHCI